MPSPPAGRPAGRGTRRDDPVPYLDGGASSENPWLAGGGRRGHDYDRRFTELAARGADVHGEARLVVSLGVRSALDAGCGTGRVAIELARRGLEVVGVDLDSRMLEAARAKAPELTWVEADLAGLDLGRRFEAVVMAGNVMLFVTPGTEGEVVAGAARHLSFGGLLVAGFSLQPGGMDLESYDRLAEAAGLERAERWASWDRDRFEPGAPYVVAIHRRPTEGRVTGGGTAGRFSR